MMIKFNKVILAGSLVSEPQRRQTATSALCEIYLAVRDSWVDGQGNDREELLHINCVGFGHVANSIHKHCKQGDQVLIEGKLRLETWEDDGGGKHSRHSVLIQGYQLLSPRDGQQREPDGRPRQVKINSSNKLF